MTVRIDYIRKPELVEGFRVDARVPADAACFCGASAERWDGGVQCWTVDSITASLKPLKPIYRCASHDPRHKWFDITPEDRKCP